MTFALVVIQNGLVIALALILNPRARARRAKEAALSSSTPSGSDEPKTSMAMGLDEEAALEARYRSMQTHKSSVSSANTLIGDGDISEKEKCFSRSSTLEVEDISKSGSGQTTPAGMYGRSRTATLTDLPGLAEVDSRTEAR